MNIIDRLESEVRSYCRLWPVEFATAHGSTLYDVDGNGYIDFFAGAGVLNYGHNDPHLKRALLDYLGRDGIVHSLDMATSAKSAFLRKFEQVILVPRGLHYKVQFPGPTGTNAVEAALKLARKVKGRDTVISFTNAFHGMTLGSLAVTGNEMKRRGAGVPLNNVATMPYYGFLGRRAETLDYLEAYLAAGGSGVDAPAAVIVETVQAEGGINVAPEEWLEGLARICSDHDMLLIVDDVQAGCGRTGPFFSFEAAGIEPDIVTLSKSLSGFGLPLAITLLKPELDVWSPGEHNGTFRGHNPAFVTATAALDYWQDETLSRTVGRKAAIVSDALQRIVDDNPEISGAVRGRGLIQGIHSPISEFGELVAREAFRRGLVMETSGPDAEVSKVLPPLTIDDDQLEQGLAIVADAVAAVAAAAPARELSLAAVGGERGASL
jgi:diaminobutyrate-2-oxoglutarate transaminase